MRFQLPTWAVSGCVGLVSCKVWPVIKEGMCERWILFLMCSLQFPAGLQLFGAVCVLDHPRTPEVCQPRTLHSGMTLFMWPLQHLHCLPLLPPHPSNPPPPLPLPAQYPYLLARVLNCTHRQPCKQVGGFRCCRLCRKSQTWSTNRNSSPLIPFPPLHSGCFSER